MVSSILPFLTQLGTTRFFPQTTGPHPTLLDTHQNSLACLAMCVRYLTTAGPPLDYQQLVRHALTLPLESNKNPAGCLVLAHSITALPYTVYHAALIQSQNITREPDSGNLLQELKSKKITKLFKK